MSYVNEISLQTALKLSADHPEANIEVPILCSLISKINDEYTVLRTDEPTQKVDFKSLCKKIILAEDTIDLFSREGYKKAVFAYYAAQRKTTKKLLAVKRADMTLEEHGPHAARVKITKSLSIGFKAINTRGTLRESQLVETYRTRPPGPKIEVSKTTFKNALLKAKAGMNASRKRLKLR